MEEMRTFIFNETKVARETEHKTESGLVSVDRRKCVWEREHIMALVSGVGGCFSGLLTVYPHEEIDFFFK